MSRRRNKAAALAKEIRRRQSQQPKLTLVPPQRTPQQYRDAFGPRPGWCEWKPWYPVVAAATDEPDEATDAEALELEAQAWREAALRSNTQYLPVVEFVLEHPWPGARR